MTNVQIEEWDLTATNLGRAAKQHYEVAVLPTGAIEPHNRHLPYGQDVRHTTWVARESCRRAWAGGGKVLCLPPIPFGVDCNLMDFPLAMHVSQQTLDAIVREVIVSCLRHGIVKFVIVNGHGGNDFTPLCRQVQCDLETHVFICDWWKVGADRYSEIFDRPDDHAGQMETSVAMALFPELVEAENAGSGTAAPFALEGLRKGYARTSRRFSQLNDHCAAGDPTGASADKGNAYLKIVVDRVAAFLAELSAAKVDKDFPHK
ncbi:MAG: creatininase family protein [Planctomycetaceae bacterium]|nr:creatininase family protein [Planctomycetaceae bacterium]